MSTYKNLIGKDVNFLSTDPDNEQAEGQIWYNSTAGVFKDLIVSEAWSSGSVMIRGSASAQLNLGTGIQTAALVAGGYSPYSNLTEEYNGSGWSSGGNLSTARITSGFGTQTAAVAVGGLTPPNTTTGVSEEYDGSSWTAGGSLNTARSYSGGSGTLTAGVSFGGLTPPFTTSNATEEYNGTAFTSVNNMNVYGRHMGSSGRGPQTATLAFGGGGGPTAPIPADTNMATTESYDGTNWTAVNSMNTARRALGSAGIQTSALAFGGSTPPNTNATESWDGTNWTTSPATLANARNTPQSIGTSSSALYAGGASPLFSSGLVEEYNRSTNVITGAAWASGGALPSPGRQGYGVGTGTQTASIIAGGPPDSTQNQFYDGASWTNLASIPSGVTNSQGFGDSEELLMAGGNTGAPYSALTYVYSRPGNSWTAVSSPGNINTARGLGAGCGALSTAGIIAGGDTPSYTTATENWNGSSWTTVNALPTATGNGVGSCGTQTAGLIWSGQNPGDPTAEETYEWDGTNWTSSGNRLIGVRAVRGGAGTQTAALTFGGWLDPGGSVSTEGYDGTSWSTRPNMAGAAANNFQTGTQTAALRAGGTDGPGYTAVEEFTGETTALNIKTITTS